MPITPKTGSLFHAFPQTEIFEADRAPVIETLERPGSVARNERGAMAVSKFKAIGRRVWIKPAAGRV
jgi:hypothetical protein